MTPHKHFRQRNHICIDCGAQLCTHYHADLRGCMLDRGHEGEHFNPNGAGHNLPNSDRDTWASADGLFINSQEDWVRLISYLGNPNSPFKGSTAAPGETLEQALRRAAERRAEVFRQSAIQEEVERKRKH